jgi:hypothetical protein
MTTQVEATFINGMLKPDVPLPLAEQARVRLTVETLETPSASTTAWEEFRTWIRENPLYLGGKRYTRDELYDRR